jgi:hypothetical protein
VMALPARSVIRRFPRKTILWLMIMSDNELRRDEEALKAILAEIEHGTIKLYRNALRQPYVFCDHPKYPVMHSHLLDKDMRSWLTHFVWETKTFLLREREVDRILEELAGRSLSGLLDTIHDPALLLCIESEPVVAVVLEFMHTRTRHEGTMDALWKDLEKLARDRRLLVRGKNRFPGGPNVLSRKLAKFVPVFEHLGITVAIKRSNGSKVTLTKRSDDSSQEPSREPSAPNSGANNDFSPMDDKAARILRLQQRKQEHDRSSHD